MSGSLRALAAAGLAGLAVIGVATVEWLIIRRQVADNPVGFYLTALLGTMVLVVGVVMAFAVTRAQRTGLRRAKSTSTRVY